MYHKNILTPSDIIEQVVTYDYPGATPKFAEGRNVDDNRLLVVVQSVNDLGAKFDNLFVHVFHAS